MKGRYYDAFSARLHCLLPEGVIFLRLLFQYNARAASTAVSGPWKGNKKSPAEAVEAAGEPWRKPRPRNATRTSRLSFEYIVKVSWLLLSRSFQDFSLSLGGCGLRHKTWIFFHFCRQMSSWHDLEPLLRRCVTAFMSTRLPRTSEAKMTSLLLEYLTVELKPLLVAKGDDKPLDSIFDELSVARPQF